MLIFSLPLFFFFAVGAEKEKGETSEDRTQIRTVAFILFVYSFIVIEAFLHVIILIKRLRFESNLNKAACSFFLYCMLLAL